MRVALAGCRAVDTWQPAGDGPRPWERDDRPLHDAFRARGATVETPAWDDPGVDWAAFHVVVPRATWDYHHHRDRFLAWVDAVSAVTALVNPASVVRGNTHKGYLRTLDVPQPDTVWLGADDVDGLPATIRARGWIRAFLKPAVGATAEGTLRFDADAAGLASAVAHARDWLARVDTMLVQPYLPTVESSGERSAIAIDGAITHFVCKRPISGDYRVQDDYGATDAPHDPSPAERALAARALASLPESLAYARVDWLLDPAGDPRLVELELVEPCLFFRHGPHAAPRLVEAVLRRARA